MGTPDPATALAIRAWNMLGGMDWSGMTLVANVLGYDDMELLMLQLETIRNRQNRN